MVYYRKYRPQTLSNLIGQEAVVQNLQKAIDSNRLAHAYLFTGPRGVGKTSTARILAKMVNCEKGGCNECEICQSINDGSSLDLIEIDAASNRGIDDIRDLRDKIKLAPSTLKKKVYIIDEVHMLTTEAFNALLKTLEEPPEHVLFILATTEVQKIPQTIMSRVQRLDFKLANSVSLDTLLKKVAENEGLEIGEEALKLISKRAEGSFRDAVKLLDQVSSLDKKITLEMVEQTIKGSKFETILGLIDSLSQKDPKASLKLLSEIISDGANLKELIMGVMDGLRALMLIQHGLDNLVKEDLGEEKLFEMKNMAKKFTKSEIIRALDSFQKAFEKMKVTTLPTLPLEIAVVESSQATVISNSAVISIPSEVEGEKSQDIETQVKTRDLSSSIRDDNKGELISVAPQSLGADIATLKDKWDYILEMIKPYNFSLGAMLKSVVIADCTEGRLTLRVPYSFHQRILEAPRNRELLESVLSDVLGKPIKVGCELDQRPIKVEELANVELAADDEVIKIAAEIFNS